MADVILIDESEFTEQELSLANSLVPQIDIFDLNLVLNYGMEPQKKLSESSDKILSKIKTKDLENIDRIFESLTVSFNSLRTDSASLNSPIGFIKRNATNTLIIEYNKIKNNIEEIIARLRDYQLTIMQDMDFLKKILKTNKKYYKEISLYILAGQKRIAQFEETPKTLQHLDTFRRRLNNLAVSRTVVMQNIAQVEMFLATDTRVLERISTIINVTIPLLKNQISINNIVSAKQTLVNLKKAP